MGKRSGHKKPILGVIIALLILGFIGACLPGSDSDKDVQSSTVLKQEDTQENQYKVEHQKDSEEKDNIEEDVNSVQDENGDPIDEELVVIEQTTIAPVIEQQISNVVSNGTISETRNNNIPYFDQGDYTTDPFEYYSSRDALGRCGTAYANICKELMPSDERGSIGMVKPTGWHTYNTKTEWNVTLSDGSFYLYNRCHLIGYQLSGENANEKNLITGTRYMNTDGMLPYENRVAQYVRSTGNHVLYRVTPIYEGQNLLASGVLMEAWSVEDSGYGICFNVFVRNIQPNFSINYADGTAFYNGQIDYAAGDSTQNIPAQSDVPNTEDIIGSYVLNTNTKRFHLPTCNSVVQMKDKNKQYYEGSRQYLIDQGYKPCGNCHP